ncbi:putative sarcoplasmic reticulum glycoprotein [Trypanosoma rangeli]|uniref:Sarcalumenin n=1 Tax=Trypanosoma rangeli TaxID=5698 RepID=A0A422P0G8_TRYRA|nr:putative sarcoplasmic reticulum glycoprotein [Trypanosoma rangeli]RNF11198.1 putative sarcoplasmic reticulum glycoprotein [Trypanosoma rangeli]|eukprot:RNF11198.1 putative sarcoplasmic reticulum glycoprotein [Trypanosoma rangeli]
MPSKGSARFPVSLPPRSAEESWDEHIDAVLFELQRLYFERVRPVEEKFQYDIFRPSWFSEAIVQKKPFVTFLGPFSAGKSTFINYLLQSNHLLTGPQPLTDKFTVIMHGEEVQQISGRVLMADSSQPFRGLSQFGDMFAEVFQGLLVPHPLLQSVSLIDTPGVLEAAGDIHRRRYDFIKVCRWFVEKSDLVFVLFDPTKLDAGTELRMLFKHALRGNESKIRIVLNKADTVGPQELMRVYGALFWNLSGLICSTEPPRVYVSSFWDQPYKKGTDHNLFTDEKSDLLYDLTEVVPLQSLDQRVTSVMQRTKLALVFALVCAAYKSRMPWLIGKDKARAGFLAQLPQIVEDLSNTYRLGVTDFPTREEMTAFLSKVRTDEFYDMNRLRKKGWPTLLKQTIEEDLPALLKPIKQSAVVDPRDRKHAIMMQRNYTKQMSDQLAGQRGIQGGLGQQRISEHRAHTMPNAAFLNAALNSSIQPSQQASLPQLTPDQMFMMMQMMQNLSSQNQQPQPQLLQLEQGPTQQLTPDQMSMMIQMMQNLSSQNQQW